MNYRFCGNLTTGATLELADGSMREVMLCPGCVSDLPEDHLWVKRMVRRGYLVPVPDSQAKKDTAKTAPPAAGKEEA